MDSIRQYLLTIIAGAMICAILSKVSFRSTANSALIKLLSEIFLLILIVSPLIKVRLPDLNNFFSEGILRTDAIAYGESYAQIQSDEIIKESATAYILDKASNMQADIQVEVFLTDSSPKIPESVVICGDVSPYIKTVLQSMIADELGVPEEAQIWN